MLSGAVRYEIMSMRYGTGSGPYIFNGYPAVYNPGIFS